MGAGESIYVQDQERFVRENVENYKNALPNHYSHSQIKGKLRQLYANTDTRNENKYSYISSYEWEKVKKAVVPKYSSVNEMRGERRYR
jgi:hypothetical protein